MGQERLIEEFTDALPSDATVWTSPDGEGGVLLQAEWPNRARLKVHLNAERAYWQNLRSEDPGAGLYTYLCTVIPPLLKQHGLVYMLMMPASDEQRDVLLRRLNWYEIGDGFYRHDL